MSNLYNFPSQFVYWEKIENHLEIKKNILPLILEHSKKLDSILDEKSLRYCQKYKCKSNYFCNDEFLINLFKKYHYENTIIWNIIDNLLNHKDLNISNFPDSSSIEKIWYNVYSPGGHHIVHTHGYEPGFSGIYILDLDEENPTTFFNSENLLLEKTLELNTIDEGTVIIFLNSLEHYVQPCLKNRVTISFNISSSLK